VFNRLKKIQEEYIRGNDNFVVFEYWTDVRGFGGWVANIEGVFTEDELRRIANALKNPTTKRRRRDREPPRLDL
jgi:hypothetical protein